MSLGANNPLCRWYLVFAAEVVMRGCPGVTIHKLKT
jgi:hypothetical protein